LYGNGSKTRVNPLSKTCIIHQAAFTFMLAQSPFWGWKSNDCMCIFADLLRGESDATIVWGWISPIFIQNHDFILGIKATFGTVSEQELYRLEIKALLANSINRGVQKYS
jgi:hypothetical protein